MKINKKALLYTVLFFIGAGIFTTTVIFLLTQFPVVMLTLIFGSGLLAAVYIVYIMFDDLDNEP